MSMKNTNDTIGNRIRILPTCSAVPQPTAPPRAPKGRWNYPKFDQNAIVNRRVECSVSVERVFFF